MKISVIFYCLDKFIKIIITEVCRMVMRSVAKSVAWDGKTEEMMYRTKKLFNEIILRIMKYFA